MASIVLCLVLSQILIAEIKDNLIVNFSRLLTNKKPGVDSVKGTIFYQPPNDILIYVTEPVNQHLKFNDKTLVIYYPDEKKAFRIQARVPFVLPFFQAFISLTNKNLGLAEMGYTLSQSEKRGDTLITRWVPPAKVKKAVGPIIIGMVNDQVGFMEMQNSKGRTIGRVSYSDYSKIGNIMLPMRVSAVRYLGKDTTYETVYYSNPRLNVKLPDEVVNFQIPKGTEIKEVSW